MRNRQVFAPVFRNSFTGAHGRTPKPTCEMLHARVFASCRARSSALVERGHATTAIATTVTVRAATKTTSRNFILDTLRPRLLALDNAPLGECANAYLRLVKTLSRRSADS